MKHYKDFPKIEIGYSDIGCVILHGPQWEALARLDFGEDGFYSAYICQGESPADFEIGAHYEEVFSCRGWLKVYDDNGLTLEARADGIKVYRAGSLGAVIALVGRPSYKTYI